MIRVDSLRMNRLFEFFKDVANEPVENDLNAWAMYLGAVVGFLIGLYMGFARHGIGGAIVGGPVGILVGGICGMLTGVIISHFIAFIPWMLILGVIALI